MDNLFRLVAIGFTRSAIEAALRSGRLHRVHRGVYAVGTPVLDAYGRALAAVLAFDDAVLSHQSAGALYPAPSLRGPGPRQPALRAPRPRRRPRPRVPRDHHWLWKGIPITTPARTLVDLADVLTQDALDATVSEAHVQRFIDRSVADRPGRRAVSPGHQLTRSQIERTYLRMVRAAPDLPNPMTNVRIGRWQPTSPGSPSRPSPGPSSSPGDSSAGAARISCPPTEIFFRIRSQTPHGQDHWHRPRHDELVHGGVRGR